MRTRIPVSGGNRKTPKIGGLDQSAAEQPGIDRPGARPQDRQACSEGFEQDRNSGIAGIRECNPEFRDSVWAAVIGPAYFPVSNIAEQEHHNSCVTDVRMIAEPGVASTFCQ